MPSEATAAEQLPTSVIGVAHVPDVCMTAAPDISQPGERGGTAGGLGGSGGLGGGEGGTGGAGGGGGEATWHTQRYMLVHRFGEARLEFQ